MKEVSVTELRQNLQAFLAQASGGQRVRVTAHGRVIAELAPPRPNQNKADRARKRLRGSVLKFKQPLLPVLTMEDWEMNR